MRFGIFLIFFLTFSKSTKAQFSRPVYLYPKGTLFLKTTSFQGLDVLTATVNNNEFVVAASRELSSSYINLAAAKKLMGNSQLKEMDTIVVTNFKLDTFLLKPFKAIIMDDLPIDLFLGTKAFYPFGVWKDIDTLALNKGDYWEDVRHPNDYFGYAYRLYSNKYYSSSMIFFKHYAWSNPDSIYGYAWLAKSYGGASDIAVLKAAKNYEIVFNISSKDSERFKSHRLEAITYLASYYYNVERNIDRALYYAEEGMKLSSIQFKEIYNVLQKKKNSKQ